MTASFTLTGTGEYFPSGTTVAVYPRAAMIPEHAPSGSSLTSAVSGSSSVAFTGLEYSTAYVAYALLGGVHKYKTFKTDDPPDVVVGPQGPAGADGASLGGIYDVMDAPYSAAGDGVADDTAAIQGAINDAKTNGGTVYLDPRKTFKISSALVMGNNTKAYRFCGGGAGGHVNVGTPTLKFTGASGSVLKCQSIFGVEIDHIRIQCTNAAYNGTAGNDMIDVDGNPLAADCTNFHIHHVATSSASGAAPRSAVRLNKAIIGRIGPFCHFGGNATNQIRVGDPAGSYVVAVEIDHNTYNNSSDAHILIGAGDAERITIRGETFEAGVSTPGIKGNNCQLYAGLIENCWFGDSGGVTTWITGLATYGNHSFCTIRDCFFATCNGGIHIANCIGGMLFEGNTFDGSTVFDLDPGGVLLACNHNDFNNATIFGGPIGGGLKPSSLSAQSNNCTGATEAKILRDTHHNRLAFGSRNAALALAVGATDDTEQLIVGAHNVAGLISPGNKAAVYSTFSGSSVDKLVLQAPSAASDAWEVQLVGGQTPTPVLRVSKDKIGEFGAPPAARPAAYTLNAGAVSRNLPSGATAAQVEQVLRQLLADFQARGTLQ